MHSIIASHCNRKRLATSVLSTGSSPGLCHSKAFQHPLPLRHALPRPRAPAHSQQQLASSSSSGCSLASSAPLAQRVRAASPKILLCSAPRRPRSSDSRSRRSVVVVLSSPHTSLNLGLKQCALHTFRVSESDKLYGSERAIANCV